MFFEPLNCTESAELHRKIYPGCMGEQHCEAMGPAGHTEGENAEFAVFKEARFLRGKHT